jgi:thiol-disulfide isomerase/thioredoxin
MKKDLPAFIVIIVISLVIVSGTFYVLGRMYFGSKAMSDLEKVQSSTDGATPYTSIDGQPFDLGQFKGKVLVVNSWASWSPFSAQELKNFQKLSNTYKDDAVAIVAINRKENTAVAKAYLKHLGNLSSIHVVLDPTDHFYTSVGGFAMPETLFYDKKGHLIEHVRGDMQYTNMQKYTEEALAGQMK